MTQSTINPRTRQMVLTAILSVLILLMTFCGIGYIPINPVLKLTLHTLPVAVGSVVLGWQCGLILGGVFGISSFLTCFGLDVFGGVLLNINPFFTLIVCLVPRLLCGLLPALIYRAVGIRDKRGIVSVPLACVSTAIINTVLFLSFLWFFFANDLISDPRLTEMVGVIDSVLVLFVTLAGINAILEAAVCLVAGTAIVHALLAVQRKFL